MRRDYYDDPMGWRRSSGVTRRDWAPSTPPAPFGPVPGHGPVAETPAKPAPAPRKRRREKRALPAFLLCLALLLGLSGAVCRWNGGLTSLWSGTVRDPWTEPVPTAAPVETTVERAPVGDGTVLVLADPAEEDLPAQDIYEKVVPSVVGIRAAREGSTALGTGVILSPDGYIITNAHVVEGSFRVDVVFFNDRKEKALLVGMDGDTDLAVLKIDAENLPAAEFGDSSFLRVGDAAYAIGNPLGEELRGTMTDGMISALDRAVTVSGSDMTLIQTTAALNTGNSGGALVSAGGQVVGITNMKMMSNWNTIEGLGFAIPSTLVKEVVDQIMEKGYYSGRPLLGVTVSNYRPDSAPKGAYVEAVERLSSAYEQGIRPGDIIIGANGLPVASVDDLEAAKAGLAVGDEMELKLWTGRGERTVRVLLMGRRDLETAPEEE